MTIEHPIEQELRKAGFTPGAKHSTPFWRSPNGQLFATIGLAFEALKAGEGSERRNGVKDRRRSGAPPLEPSHDLAAIAAQEARRQSTHT